jgi:uncharacterized protein (TIGR02452 family)
MYTNFNRVKIIHETFNYIETNNINYEQAEVFDGDTLIKIAKTHPDDIKTNAKTKTKIIFSNKDSFETAYIMKTKYKCNSSDICVLNMGSRDFAGGGCLSGQSAQEEALCRSSTLYLSLQKTEDDYDTTPYPLTDAPVGLYCKSTVIRGSEAQDYEFYESLGIEPMELGVITMSAIRKPRLETKTKKNKLNEGDARKMTLKIRAIINKAIIEKHRVLILSAFGCGIYGNPPEHIAAIMKREIKKMGYHFDYVVFAILQKDYDTVDNLAIFKSVFIK